MPAIRKHRRRRNSVLVGLVSVALSLNASCGGVDKFQLTLRTRDFDGSWPLNVPRPWLAADGRRATSPAETSLLSSDTKFGDVECGDESYSRRFFTTSTAELTRGTGAFDLEIDDGNRLSLDPQTAVDVADGTSFQTACFHEVGTWRGTAGDMQYRTGTYTLHYDSIQTLLRLVED